MPCAKYRTGLFIELRKRAKNMQPKNSKQSSRKTPNKNNKTKENRKPSRADNKKEIKKKENIKERKSNEKIVSPEKKAINKEIILMSFIAVGIFTAIALQTTAAGSFGEIYGNVFKGLFGAPAFLIPYLVIGLSILLFVNSKLKANAKFFVLNIISFLMIDIINAGRFLSEGTENTFGSPLKDFYFSGIRLQSGGVFGMEAGTFLFEYLGIAGLYIVSILVLFICIILLVEMPVSAMMEKAKEKREEQKKKNEEIKKSQKVYKNKPLAFNNFNEAEEKKKNILSFFLNDKDKAKDHINNLSENKKNIIKEVKDIDDIGLSKKTESKKEKSCFEKSKPKEKSPIVIIGAKNEEKEKKKDKEKDAHVVEEKISKSEAKNLMLKKEELNTENVEKYIFPPIDILSENKSRDKNIKTEAELLEKAQKLETVLHSFNIDASVVNVTQGPAVTRYEVHPNSGVKVRGIKNLADDIALNMEAKTIRIEAPIPGKSAVGIEIENDKINMVTIREIIESEKFKNAKSKISFAVGKDIAGNDIVADLKTMPHLLIAGSTGSGKSVCINSIITSFIYKADPNEVKLVLVDPKVVELANYNGIPHLLIPVVTDASKAAAALNWAVAEMDDRYKKFAEEHARDLKGYNEKLKEEGRDEEALPQIVIVIDELADLMMVASSQVEDAICRLAQKARAAGMHLIVATQRPSVDVITGLIKANIPSRIAFAVSSQVDSRTILDMAGAEKLVGKGDMLFSPLGNGKPLRVQGTFISDKEVNSVIDFVKSQTENPGYEESIINKIENTDITASENNCTDELFNDAIDFVLSQDKVSTSMLQRRFRIGYNRAARLIDSLEEQRIIGPQDGSRPRDVLITEAEYKKRREKSE